MLAEPGAIIFCTARGKDFYRQLIHDGRVAVTALSEAFQMVRFQGVARRLPSSEQHDWIDRIFDANPSMNDVYPKDARYVLEAFVLDNGELELFDLGTSPIYRRAFTLTVYALLPMVRNTHTGLSNIDPAILEAARGMGSTR